MKKPDAIIISSPRSGLNWVRYCIEWFSKCPTPGIRRPVSRELLSSKDFIICRTHNALSKRKLRLRAVFNSLYDNDDNPVFKKAILLIRNYKELYARKMLLEDGIKKKIIDAHTANSDIILSFSDKTMMGYANNIEAYDKFPGRKIYIYYEDLVSDFSQMLKILDFIGINYDLSDFNLEEHRLKSVKAYSTTYRDRLREGIREVALTTNDPLNFTFHSSKCLGDKHKKALDSAFQKKMPILYEKYLNRYKEENLKL